MSRAEFSKETKRLALKRSGGLCEATGTFYGLDKGKRCNAPLSYGVEFDHVLADSNGGKPTLENAVASCKRCHKYKTTKYDTPRAAKTVRQRDKDQGVTGPKQSWPSRKMNPPRFDNTKRLEEL